MSEIINNRSSKFTEKLCESWLIMDKQKDGDDWESVYMAFIALHPKMFSCSFNDNIQVFFPVLKGTPHTAKDSMFLLSTLEVKLLGELSIFPNNEESNTYEEKIDYMLNLPLTKEMFKGHSLFLLKEHCRQFSQYNKKLDLLMEKLENLERGVITEPDKKRLEEIEKERNERLFKLYNLQRFVNAQDYGDGDGTSDYKTALEEIKDGCKRTHWIWYVFPQMKGLGHSKRSDHYGIEGREEAYLYIKHPILSSRLVEATEAVLNNKHSVYDIFGWETIKFRSCVLLFSTVSDNPVFKKVIQKYRWN